MEGFNFQVLEGVDPIQRNIVGCGVYESSEGRAGCLLRLEPNYEKKVGFFLHLSCLFSLAYVFTFSHLLGPGY